MKVAARRRSSWCRSALLLFDPCHPLFLPITSQQKHEHRIVPTMVSFKTPPQQAAAQLWGIVTEKNHFDWLFSESELKSETGKEEFVTVVSMISAF